jgi:hypothetical protein
MRASRVLSMATPYRRMGARVGKIKLLRRRGGFARMQVKDSSELRFPRVTGVHWMT